MQGVVRAIPVFGCDSSSTKGFSRFFYAVLREGHGSGSAFVGKQYDWTTKGTGHRGGQWKGMEEVQRRTSLAPLASPCFTLSLLSLEAEEGFSLPGEGGDHFHCAVEPSSGHIRYRFWFLENSEKRLIHLTF